MASETTAPVTLQQQTSANNPNSPHDGPIELNGALSDEESNSWADSVSLSEEEEKDDYYDQEEYYEETKKPTQPEPA